MGGRRTRASEVGAAPSSESSIGECIVTGYRREQFKPEHAYGYEAQYTQLSVTEGLAGVYRSSRQTVKRSRLDVGTR